MLINNIKHQVCISNLFQKYDAKFLYLDREAIGEYEAKVKELRKQVDDMVTYDNVLKTLYYSLYVGFVLCCSYIIYYW
jgi:hypothetical protein